MESSVAGLSTAPVLFPSSQHSRLTLQECHASPPSFKQAFVGVGSVRRVVADLAASRTATAARASTSRSSVGTLELEAWRWTSSAMASVEEKPSGNGREREARPSEEHKRQALRRPLSGQNMVESSGSGLPLRVSYQGVPGAYSEAAALRAFPGCEVVPCEQFDAAFQAVELWLADRGMLPIENSLGGSIHRNYDLLLRHRLHIVGEVYLGVHHCLLALPGQRLEDIKRVMSHPQALAQCESTLSRLKQGLVREAVDDTAGAARMVAEEKLEGCAAIASARAAEIYGMQILVDGIQDDLDNVTRFLVLSREPILPKADQSWKTSIVFTLEEGPGVLFKALAAFALRNINLTKIESRPQRKNPLRVVLPHEGTGSDAQAGLRQFEYLFYIDFQASMAEMRAQNALRHLQEFAPFLRVLGSYPMDSSPINNK